MLHVVQLRELPPVVGRRVLLELLQGLPAQVRPVHQEQHPLRTGVLDEPVGGANRRERLAASGSHLDERAWPVLREGVLQPIDSLDLAFPQSASPDGGTRIRAGSGSPGRARPGLPSQHLCSRRRKEVASRPSERAREALLGTFWTGQPPR
jgi:hypothetical protein